MYEEQQRERGNKMSAIERYRGKSQSRSRSQQVAVAIALMSRVNRLRLVTGSVQPASRAMHPRGRHSVRLYRRREHSIAVAIAALCSEERGAVCCPPTEVVRVLIYM